MNGKWIIWCLLGAVCFIVSQPLLRLPILQYLQSSTDFMLAYTLNPMLFGILIALSAGVFEESFRFLFKQFLLKPHKCAFSQPIIFGLGHGVAEAIMVLLPALSIVPVSQLGLAFFERVMAIILHINLTILVWNGFQRNRRFIYLLIAIGIHGFVNSLIPILSQFQNSILFIEGALVVINILMTGYSYYSRKYYA
ncbi:MAG: YhfC family intramembrane metalloprotease [Clostridiales bacterium]|mgnify:CR=1 FL=1|nr:YhfC family intramembrane metalloprotease [Clostridiales bacterium]